MTRRVLVTHPGRQHSHRAALALEAGGRLAGYWSGVPGGEGRLPPGLRRRLVRAAPVPLPPERLRSAVWAPALRRLGGTLPAGLATRVDFAVCRAFDRWAAAHLDASTAGAVVACEISALTTFRTAKRLGWITLLDAPSLHHSAQDRLHGFREPASLHRRIVAVKDAEIELADAIVTVSSLARSSYVDAGVPGEKVVAIALGADLQLFDSSSAPPRSGPCRFLFAGAPIARKGFDLLIEALGRLVEAGVPFHLRLAGPNGDLSPLLSRLPRGHWSAAGSLPQAVLAGELAAADCLVLPSRNDSYGMVVAESLAAGTPVVISTMVGAADLVEEGIEGWIVRAGETAPLAERLAAIARAPESLRAMRNRCRKKARAASWEAYESRFVAALEPWLA